MLTKKYRATVTYEIDIYVNGRQPEDLGYLEATAATAAHYGQTNNAVVKSRTIQISENYDND